MTIQALCPSSWPHRPATLTLLTADCQNGRLNGSDPSSAAAAQLLHAACQVAFGPG